MRDRPFKVDQRLGDIVPAKNSKFSTLQKATTIIGALFLLFFIVSFFSSSTGNPVSNKLPFNAFDKEQILNKLSFVLFAIGYLLTFKHKALAGITFILSWLGMWYVSHYLVAPQGREANGGVLAIPIFILGIAYLFSSFKKK